MNRIRTIAAAIMAAGTFLHAPLSLAEAPSADAEVAMDDAGADAPADDAAEPVDADADADAEAPSEASDADTEAEAETEAAIDAVELEAEPSVWTRGLMMSIAAMCIGGFSAMLGIWVDRDKSRPKIFAFSMSFLIFCALLVGVAQAYIDQMERIEKDQDLERMLDMTYEIAVASGDPELVKLVEESSGIELDVPEAAPEAAPEPEPTVGSDDAVPAQ